MLVNGKTPGETSLIIWQQGGNKMFFDVGVRPESFEKEPNNDAAHAQPLDFASLSRSE